VLDAEIDVHSFGVAFGDFNSGVVESQALAAPGTDRPATRRRITQRLGIHGASRSIALEDARTVTATSVFPQPVRISFSLSDAPRVSCLNPYLAESAHESIVASERHKSGDGLATSGAIAWSNELFCSIQ
jgi:hypothetical protein